MTPFETASTTTMGEILQAYPSAKVGLFQFTVGGPVEDTRLTTLPAYNLEEAR